MCTHTDLPCISPNTPIYVTAVFNHWQISLYNTLMISEYHRKWCDVFCLSWVLNLILKTTFFLQNVKHRLSTHESGKLFSSTHRPPLPPRIYRWYSFLSEVE